MLAERVHIVGVKVPGAPLLQATVPDGRAETPKLPITVAVQVVDPFKMIGLGLQLTLMIVDRGVVSVAVRSKLPKLVKWSVSPP